jgi:hypothetical protein
MIFCSSGLFLLVKSTPISFGGLFFASVSTHSSFGTFGLSFMNQSFIAMLYTP